MKLVILALLVSVAVILASPLDMSKKNEAFNKCAKICDSTSNRPLCATNGDKINLSFLNECALQKYNCEHNTILTKKSDGECSGGGGIRIS